ncbi:MAG: hypothetical protein E4H18_05895 [Hyphomicrobiales bacterium]|nr:MAG: hypothetical protein E4H18_05895 [Hyphomicrobiales bacterium]
MPKVEKGIAQGQRAAYNKQLADWRKDNAGEIAAANEADANARLEEQKVWVPDQAAVPMREGQPARAAVKGHWDTRRVRVDNPVARPAAPPAPQTQYWTLEDFVRHLAAMQVKFYEPKGRRPAVIHCIGYQIDKEGGTFLRKLTNKYQGRYRRVAKVD